MRIPLTILALVGLALGAFYLFAPAPDPQLLQARTDMPWQIQVRPDGGSRVFDLELGRATLDDARGKFGAVENFAIFERDADHSDLEAYFGDVGFGMLQAKVVVKLQAEESERRQMMEQARGREASPSGDWKYPLPLASGEHLGGRLVTAISYVPSHRGLDRAFFEQRFGTPAYTLTENEHAVSWFYPDKGVSILIDDKGREVLEYLAPRDFVTPGDSLPYTSIGN